MSYSDVRQSAGGSMSVSGAEREDVERLLTPEILTLAAVVILGAIMTILDATIVNVAPADTGP